MALNLAPFDRWTLRDKAAQLGSLYVGGLANDSPRFSTNRLCSPSTSWPLLVVVAVVSNVRMRAVLVNLWSIQSPILGDGQALAFGGQVRHARVFQCLFFVVIAPSSPPLYPDSGR
jgi:hypothetical protein